MKNFIGKKNFSVFSKILLGFLLVIAPLYFFSIQVNILGQNDIKEEIIESYKARTSFYLASLENEFSSILKAQTKLIMNADLIQLTSSSKTGEVDDYQYYKEINSVRSMLAELKETSSLVDTASIYIPSVNLKISNLIISDMQEEDFNRMKAVTVKRVLPFNKMEDGYYINITSSDNYLNREGASIDYIISVKLSMANVESMLNTLSADSNSTAILVGGSHGLDMAQKSEEKLTEYFKEYIEKQNIKNEKVFIGSANTPQGRYVFSYNYSQLLDSALIVYELEENIMSTLLRHRTWLWIMSLLTFIMVFAFSFWIREMITHPLNKLLKAFSKIEDGTLDIAVNYHRSDEFGALYNRFNEMFQKLRVLIEQVYEQKIHVREAELKQLQYQINPHFLYNNILIINNLIKMSDFECAQKLTQHLGKYYQYITKTIAEDVPLQKEISHMWDYLEIQTIRFQNRVTVEVDELPGECANKMVPRLILQPIVENAFSYGLKDKVSIGKLCIRICKADPYFSIFVEDNGENLSDGKLEEIQASLLSSELEFAGSSSALMNVHRRIRIKFGINSGLWVTRGVMGGLCVEVRIEWDGDKGGNNHV